MPQSATLVLHPVIHVHGLLLIYRPMKDGWLSWPCWLTDSGRLNHKVVNIQLAVWRRIGKVRRPRPAFNHYATPPTYDMSLLVRTQKRHRALHSELQLQTLRKLCFCLSVFVCLSANVLTNFDESFDF